MLGKLNKRLYVLLEYIMFCTILSIFIILLTYCNQNDKIDKPYNDDFLKGRYYLQHDSLNKAVYYFTTAEKYFRLDHQIKNQIKCLRYLTDCNCLLGKFGEAKVEIESAISLASNHLLRSDPLYIGCLLSKGQIYNHTGNYDSATYIVKHAISFIPRNLHFTDSLKACSYHVLGVILYMKGSYSEAMKYFQKAISFHELPTESDLSELPTCYMNAGLALKQLGNISEAYQYYKKAFAIQKKAMNMNRKALCDLYLTFGSTLIELGLFEQGKSCVDSAEVYLTQNELFYNEQRLILSKRGILYLKSGDYKNAYIYFTSAQNICTHLKLNNQVDEDYYQYKAICEFYQGKYLEALEFYQRSLYLKKTNKSQNSSDIYDGIALCYKARNDADSAAYYYDKAISTRLMETPVRYAYLARDYLNIGSFYLGINQNEKALIFFQKALAYCKSVFGNRHPDVANCLTSIAQYYEKKGVITKSLDYYQKALIANSRSFTNMDCFSLPAIQDEYSDIVYLNILKSKAKALKKYFELDKSKLTPYYVASLSCYEQAAKILNQLSVGYQEQESQSFLARKENHTYVQGVLTSLDLYKITSDLTYKQRAFSLAENSTAAVYRASTSSNKALHWQGLPDSIIAQEHQLNSFLIASRVSLGNAKIALKPDNERIHHLEEECFKFQDKRSRLISFIEKKYPEYYQIKYSMKSLESTELQKLLVPGQVLVKYIVFDSLLISFVFSRDTFAILQHIIEKEHLSDIEYYLTQLRNYLPGTLHSDYFKEFLQTSYRLYTLLVKPVLEITNCKNLIVIPDDKLALLPFESLLTQKLNKISTFKQLPYLIRKISIGYGISAYHAISQLNNNKNERLGNLLAFAPFTNKGTSNPNTNINSYKNSTNLYPLPCSFNEVNEIVNTYGGKLLIDKNATKKAFTKSASHYKILHLATHAVADESGQEHSKLYFYPADGRSEDGILQADELPSIKLNARMVVLSSCNSGNGQIISGTGVLSMAHSFACAGCPSVVMSLWTSNDKSNSELMKYFYQGLKKGLNKSEALREAKLSYLDSTDPLFAHPYYWSSLISFGNNETISTKSASGPLLLEIYALLCLVVITLVFLFQNKH